MASRNGVIPILAADGIMDGNNPRGLSQVINSVRLHDFGHSLTHYTGGDVAPASTYTSAMNWCGWLAQLSSTDFSGGGNFGFIANHNADWGPPTSININLVTNTIPYWTEGSFAAEGITDFLFMASNFEQLDDTPADALAGAVELLDNISAIYPNARYHMYSHWPLVNMAGSGTFVDNANLTPAEFTTYNTYTATTYWNWHRDWYNLIVAQRPALDIKILPVGQVVADLFENEAYIDSLAFNEWAGDPAPHLSESGYLLAAIALYQGLYRQQPDLSSFTLPTAGTPASALPSEIGSNLVAISNYLWNRRPTYVNSDGSAV